MKYGYFEETAREYVITNPNTPAPWANYLGSPEYGAIVTQNAGGYSFVKSGAAGRILRYTFKCPITNLGDLVGIDLYRFKLFIIFEGISTNFYNIFTYLDCFYLLIIAECFVIY